MITRALRLEALKTGACEACLPLLRVGERRICRRDLLEKLTSIWVLVRVVPVVHVMVWFSIVRILPVCTLDDETRLAVQFRVA